MARLRARGRRPAPGRHFVASALSPFVRTRVDRLTVREAWVRHPDLEVITRSALLGEEARVLDLGAHQRAVVWIDGRVAEETLRVVHLDLREQVLDVAGQEIMTADKVTLRLNALAVYRVTDPETAAMRSQANTARIFESNPTLMRLRELEVLEKVAEKANLSVVLGEGGLADRVVKLL